MQNNIIKRKVLATMSVFILIIIGFLPSTQSLKLRENNTCIKSTFNTVNEGTLSGFVRDSSNNSIKDALIRVYFHEEYRENYSDSNGYYIITDIPICYCLKNATCSKVGYQTQWVLLAIYENTTYDFTLNPLGPCYPVFNGTLGNGYWFLSPVEVSFVYNPQEIAEIWYNYQGWINYTEPFIIDEEGIITVEYYWVDFEGVQSPIQSFTVCIDQTPPDTLLQWEIFNKGFRWYVNFILTANDTLSGMAPYLLTYLNDVLQGEWIVFDWENVEFGCQLTKNYRHLTFGFACFDNAGNLAYESVNGSDIKTINQRFYTQKFYNMYIQTFLLYFKNLFFKF
jgi:hypothetical protein